MNVWMISLSIHARETIPHMILLKQNNFAGERNMRKKNRSMTPPFSPLSDIFH